MPPDPEPVPPERRAPPKDRAALLLNLLQTLAIVVGLVYGAIQLTQFRSEQRRQSKLEMARSFMTPDFHDAYALVLAMPDSLERAGIGAPSAATIESLYGADMPELLLLAQTFESIGILVHQGDLDLAMVDDFFGIGIITSWRNLEPWFLEFRRDNDASSAGEWFQWLAERLEEYRASAASPPPAYEAFRDWRPDA